MVNSKAASSTGGEAAETTGLKFRIKKIADSSSAVQIRRPNVSSAVAVLTSSDSKFDSSDVVVLTSSGAKSNGDILGDKSVLKPKPSDEGPQRIQKIREVAAGVEGKEVLAASGRACEATEGTEGIEVSADDEGREAVTGGKGKEAMVGGRAREVVAGGEGKEAPTNGEGKEAEVGGRGRKVTAGRSGGEAAVGERGIVAAVDAGLRRGQVMLPPPVSFYHLKPGSNRVLYTLNRAVKDRPRHIEGPYYTADPDPNEHHSWLPLHDRDVTLAESRGREHVMLPMPVSLYHVKPGTNRLFYRLNPELNERPRHIEGVYYSADPDPNEEFQWIQLHDTSNREKGHKTSRLWSHYDESRLIKVMRTYYVNNMNNSWSDICKEVFPRTSDACRKYYGAHKAYLDELIRKDGGSEDRAVEIVERDVNEHPKAGV